VCAPQPTDSTRAMYAAAVVIRVLRIVRGVVNVSVFLGVVRGALNVVPVLGVSAGLT
jgi:hypothetical protein